MANIVFQKGDTSTIANIPVGNNILFDTESYKIYVDDNGTRKQYGGAIDVDNAFSLDSTNPLQNKIISKKIGSGDISKVGDGTITGAIADLAEGAGLIKVSYEDFKENEETYRASGKQYLVETDGDLSDASDVSYDNTDRDLESTTVQGAIDEIAPKKMTQSEYDALTEIEKKRGAYIITDRGMNGDASDIPYDNTTSSMSATNVQDAVDELKENLADKTDVEELSGYTNVGCNVIYAYRVGHLVVISARVDSIETVTTAITGLPKAKFTSFGSVNGVNTGGAFRIDADSTTLTYYHMTGTATNAKFGQIVYYTED